MAEQQSISFSYPQTIKEGAFYRPFINTSVWEVGLRARIFVEDLTKDKAWPFPVTRFIAIVAIEFFKEMGCVVESSYRFACTPSWRAGKELVIHVVMLVSLGLYNAVFYSSQRQEEDLIRGQDFSLEELDLKQRLMFKFQVLEELKDRPNSFSDSEECEVILPHNLSWKGPVYFRSSFNRKTLKLPDGSKVYQFEGGRMVESLLSQ